MDIKHMCEKHSVNTGGKLRSLMHWLIFDEELEESKSQVHEIIIIHTMV